MIILTFFVKKRYSCKLYLVPMNWRKRCKFTFFFQRIVKICYLFLKKVHF